VIDLTTAAPSAVPIRHIGGAGRIVDLRSGRLRVRLAMSSADIDAAQALRYRVFYEALGARPANGCAVGRRDVDRFDEDCDHLLVLDRGRGRGPEAVVGTYRLIRRPAAARLGGFYSAGEYDIARLLEHPGEILELGRSCVDAAYRQRPTMRLLWSGIAAYVFHHEIGLMFGCASLSGTDLDALAAPLSYLYHRHLAPPSASPRPTLCRYAPTTARGGRPGFGTRGLAATDQRLSPPRWICRRRCGGRRAVQHHRRLHRGQDRSRRRKIFPPLRAAGKAPTGKEEMDGLTGWVPRR
jgi:putative hemolysin